MKVLYSTFGKIHASIQSEIYCSRPYSRRSYKVIKEFQDYDGILHPVGEHWRFVQKDFLPYEDGLTVFVERDGQNKSIRLQWRDETRGRIIDDFSGYAEEL